MNKLLVMTPTRGRLDKLKNLLASIPIDKRLRICVVCDGDRATRDWLTKNQEPAGVHTVLYIPEHCGSVAARNHAASNYKFRKGEGLLYATDDIVFTEGAFDQIFKEFNAAFFDDDGVLGIQQSESHDPAGVGVIGLPFLDRYPTRHFLHPGYYHFAATEIRYFANRLGRFVSTNNPLVQHKHPAFYPEALDQTHKDARRFHHRDAQLKAEREAKNLVWGLSNET